MGFDTFIEQAWTDHASTPRAVATRLQEGAALAADESQIAQMANFAHHLLGEHLGEWHAGREFIEGLSSLPAFTPEGISGGAVRRCIASLLLSEASPTDEAAGARVAALPTSDRIRVNAMTTANLAERDTARAMRLFDAALRLADAVALPAADPVNRAMAVASNNLASALEEKPQRSGDERELMILAATAARRFWGVAGT